MMFVFEYINSSGKSFFTIREVARLFNRHPNTIRAWDELGALPASRTPGQQRQWSKQVLMRFGASMNYTR